MELLGLKMLKGLWNVVDIGPQICFCVYSERAPTASKHT